jgi:hypothetical protein
VKILDRNRAFGALAIAFAAAAATTALAIFPPASFGARLEFLFYMREGFVAGTILRFLVGIALVAGALGAAAFWDFAALWCAAAARLATGSTYVLMLIAIPASSAFWIGWGTQWTVCLTRDSQSYLDFETHRTIAYPALLAGLQWAFSDWDAALFWVQTSSLLAAMAVLAHFAGRLLEDRLAALVALAFMAGNASLLGYGIYMLAEAPFAALLCLHLAAILAAVKCFSWRAVVAAGLALGLAVLMRPIGYAFAAALPGLLLTLPKRRVAGAIVAAAAMALPLLGAATLNQVRHGFFGTQDFGGYSLLGHTAQLIAADMPTQFGDLPARIARRTAPIAAEIARQDFPHGHWRTTMNRYNPMLYNDVLPEIAAWRAEHADAPTMSEMASALAREAIRHDPLGYARNVASHYYGLWLLSFLPQGPIASRAAACHAADTSAPIAPMREEAARAGGDTATPVDVFWAVATLAQFPAIGAALVACWLAIPLWFGAAAQSAQRRAAIQTALAINAYFLLFATMQVALPRYSTVVEPYLVVLLVLLAAPKTIRS